ncbi:hypothetical protein [Lacrimispora celerecrescens]|uniref:hypothetical protein n=1 Tax=Lacrimispora celerecrescens TaxID=29354 RepID=UPI000AA25ADF|nr:hypothetical protein [Lacrimispora celerecrescens]
MSEHKEIGKYISIIQRLNNAYFANQLSSYQIGCGQQFFLLQIFKKPGMSCMSWLLLAITIRPLPPVRLKSWKKKAML